jgi:hypothetical protein
MKKQTLASFGLSLVFMFAAILGAAAPAQAADNFGARLTYEIPFDFYVGDEKMAAGKYEVQRISQWTYQIRSVASEKSMLIAAHTPTGDEDSVKSAKLVFNQYGQHHFLRKVYTQTRANGRFLNQSKTERRVKMESESEENLAKGKRGVVEIKSE